MLYAVLLRMMEWGMGEPAGERGGRGGEAQKKKQPQARGTSSKWRSSGWGLKGTGIGPPAHELDAHKQKNVPLAGDL
jgi:hypothetical protein